MFKMFIPPQTDGMIRSSFNIGCSKSKVILKWRKTTRTTTKKRTKRLYRPLQGANVRTSCIWQTKDMSMRPVDTQKSLPWACDKGCAESCAERFSALNALPCVRVPLIFHFLLPIVLILWGNRLVTDVTEIQFVQQGASLLWQTGHIRALLQWTGFPGPQATQPNWQR